MASVVAQNTRRIINERGLKQSAVARMAGYTPQQFSHMMNNRKLITDKDIVAISQVLEVAPNVLFGISSPDKEAS